MKELSLDEIKKVELGILTEFDRFCTTNGLKYSLAEGTLIGAVRHMGFIPWDDDIDVLMLREDFDIFRKTYQSERYSIIQAPKDKYWPYAHIRLSDNETVVEYNEFNNTNTYYKGGIWMDILPMDNFPDDDSELKKREKKILFLFRLYRAYRRNGFLRISGVINNISWLIAKIITLFISPGRLMKRIESLMCAYNQEKTERKGTWTCYWHSPWKYPSRCFDSFDSISFEGKTFMVIKDYDEYLKCQYGEYMKLPPIEKRVATHAYKAYYL